MRPYLKTSSDFSLGVIGNPSTRPNFNPASRGALHADCSNLQKTADSRTEIMTSLQAPKSVPCKYSQQIASKLDLYPDLNAAGWRPQSMSDDEHVRQRAACLDDDFERQVALAIAWQHGAPDVGKAIRSSGSYGLKHRVERWARGIAADMGFDAADSALHPYCSNGAFIVAALVVGWQPHRGTNDGPNCSFEGRLTDLLRSDR